MRLITSLLELLEEMPSVRSVAIQRTSPVGFFWGLRSVIWLGLAWGWSPLLSWRLSSGISTTIHRHRIRSWNLREQSIAAIVRLGGEVGPYERSPPSLAVSLTGETVTDAALRHLAPLVDVVTLDLEDAGITDEGLASLKPLTRLRELNLTATAITGAGFKHLKTLRELNALVLWRCPISSLAGLQGVGQITFLGLSDTPIDGQSLEPVAQLTDLEELDLSRTRIADAGLAALKRLARLERLDLSDLPITDAGLESLKDLKELRSLNLSKTRITGTGFKYLKALRNLDHLEAFELPDPEPRHDRFERFSKS